MSSPDSNETNQPSDTEIAAQKEIILKQLLSSDARLRLNNIKMVKPETASQIGRASCRERV